MKILPHSPELDAETRSVIDAARSGYEPSELSRARVRKGVEIKLAAGIALAVGPAAATSAFAGAVKLTAAVVAVGSVVGAGVYVYPRVMSKPVPVKAHVAARPASVVTAPPVEIEAYVPPAVAPPRAPAKRRVPVAAAPVAVENISSLKEETALLGAANGALARGDVKRALALLEDYDRRPGAAQLAQERAVTGILAACAGGKIGAARGEARQFRARWPRSPLGARVDGSCAGIADPSRLQP